MVRKIRTIVVLGVLISSLNFGAAQAANQSADRNSSNNNVACTNTQSAKSAPTSNSRASTCSPTVTSISPNIGSTLGGQLVTISGTNLANVNSVTFGTLSVTPFSKTSTSLQVNTPVQSNPGSVNITVSSPSGSITQLGGYTYYAPPTITSVSPNSGSTSGNQPVTIYGTNLQTTNQVLFGSYAATVQISSPNQITVLTPNVPSAGNVDISLTTLGGSITSAGAFTYTVPFSPLLVNFVVYVKPGGCGTSDNPCTPLPNGVAFDICESSSPLNCVTIDNTYSSPKSLTLNSINSTVRITYKDSNVVSLGLKYFVYVFRNGMPDVEYIPSPAGSDFFYNNGEYRDSTSTFSNSQTLVFGVYGNIT